MLKHMIVVLALVFGLTGCALTQSPTGQFNTVPAAQKDLSVYTCYGASEKFANFQPQVSNLQLWPITVQVFDVGSSWAATYEGGKLESPQLYNDLIGKVDGAIDTKAGTRYYRVNGVSPTFSYSSVDADGNGSGVTFFRCRIGSLVDPVPPLLNPPGQ